MDQSDSHKTGSRLLLSGKATVGFGPASKNQLITGHIRPKCIESYKRTTDPPTILPFYSFGLSDLIVEAGRGESPLLSVQLADSRPSCNSVPLEATTFYSQESN